MAVSCCGAQGEIGEVYISDDPLDAKIIEGFRLNHLNMRDAGSGKVVLRHRPPVWRCGERACSLSSGSERCANELLRAAHGLRSQTAWLATSLLSSHVLHRRVVLILMMVMMVVAMVMVTR